MVTFCASSTDMRHMSGLNSSGPIIRSRDVLVVISNYFSSCVIVTSSENFQSRNIPNFGTPDSPYIIKAYYGTVYEMSLWASCKSTIHTEDGLIGTYENISRTNISGFTVFYREVIFLVRVSVASY